MTVTAGLVEGDPDTRPRPRLGVFALAGRGFGLMRDALGPLVVASLVLAWLRVGANYGVQRGLVGAGVDLAIQRTIARGAVPSAASIAATLAIFLVGLLVYALSHAALTDVALRREAGEAPRARTAWGAALRFALPTAWSYLAVGILVVLGLVALVVPGLWLIGVYAVVNVDIVAEDRRRGFLRRTRDLTRTYRWPLVGLILLTYLVAAALGLAAYGTGRLLPLLGEPRAIIPLALLVDGLTTGLATAYAIAVSVLAYRRLRAIKEGGAPGDLRAIFG